MRERNKRRVRDGRQTNEANSRRQPLEREPLKGSSPRTRTRVWADEAHPVQFLEPQTMPALFILFTAGEEVLLMTSPMQQAFIGANVALTRKAV